MKKFFGFLVVFFGFFLAPAVSGGIGAALLSKGELGSAIACFVGGALVIGLGVYVLRRFHLELPRGP